MLSLDLQDILLNSSSSNVSNVVNTVKPLEDEHISSRPRGWLNWLSRGMLGAGGTVDSSQFSGVISDDVVKVSLITPFCLYFPISALHIIISKERVNKQILYCLWFIVDCLVLKSSTINIIDILSVRKKVGIETYILLPLLFWCKLACFLWGLPCALCFVHMLAYHFLNKFSTRRSGIMSTVTRLWNNGKKDSSYLKFGDTWL